MQTLSKQSAVVSQLSGEINTSVHPHKENAAVELLNKVGCAAALSALRLPSSFLLLVVFLLSLYLTASDPQWEHCPFPPHHSSSFSLSFSWCALKAGMWLDRHHQSGCSWVKIKPPRKEKHPMALQQSHRKKQVGEKVAEYQLTNNMDQPVENATESSSLCGNDSNAKKCPYC